MMEQVLGKDVVLILRDKIKEYYELDINDAVFYYSTTNCAFIFEGSPYMIRVSFRNPKSKADILNEVLWIDDIKSIADTICEPKPSLRNKLMEELTIHNQTYRICMFRTAKGNVVAPEEMTPMFFICVGELLGKIHHVSCDEQQIGMKFKRQTIEERFEEEMEKMFPEEGETSEYQKMMLDVVERLKEYEKTPETYGLCHCDFHMRNFFADGNNIWVFDFDSCLYADYMYDVATFVLMSLMFGYGKGKGKDARSLIYEDMLPYFKIGYALNKETTPQDWEKLDLLIRYKLMYVHMMVMDIDECGVTEDFEQTRNMLAHFAMQKEEDMYTELTNYLI